MFPYHCDFQNFSVFFERCICFSNDLCFSYSMHILFAWYNKENRVQLESKEGDLK